jgi:RNA polymerase sigma factor (sigma-70 family)
MITSERSCGSRRKEGFMKRYTECSDEQLMNMLCGGDKDALLGLVERYQNDLFRFCLHFLGSTESARDVTQETFLRIYTARERFDSDRVFRPWMLCIARNMCLNLLKRRKTVHMESLDAYETREDGSVRSLSQTATDHPMEAILADERKRALLQLVNELPIDMREVIVLRYFEQLSFREIAEVLESTEGAVRTRSHRALNLLRRKTDKRTDIQ